MLARDKISHLRISASSKANCLFRLAVQHFLGRVALKRLAVFVAKNASRCNALTSCLSLSLSMCAEVLCSCASSLSRLDLHPTIARVSTMLWTSWSRKTGTWFPAAAKWLGQREETGRRLLDMLPILVKRQLCERFATKLHCSCCYELKQISHKLDLKTSHSPLCSIVYMAWRANFSAFKAPFDSKRLGAQKAEKSSNLSKQNGQSGLICRR